MKKGVASVFFLMILASPVLAADRNYYFDASAANGGDGSQSSPFNELGDVNWDAVHNNIISGNDVYLLLKRGEVFLVPDNWAGWRFFAGGTPSNRIYVMGYGTGDLPIIDARGGNRGIYLSGSGVGRNSGYITIDGIEIRNGYDAIEGPDVTHLVVKNCKFHDFLLRCMNAGSYAVIGGAPGEGNEMYDCGRGTGGCDVCINDHDVVVSYNHLYATKDFANEDARGIDGVAVTCESQSTSQCYNILIEHNEIHDHNDNYYGSYDNKGYNGKGEDGIDLKKAYDVTVRYNHIYNHFYQSGITAQMGSHDIKIYGNYLHDNDWGGVYIKRGCQGSGDMENIDVWGNILYNNAGGVVLSSSGGNYEGCDGPSNLNDVGIYNNVLAENGNWEGNSFSQTGVAIDIGSSHIVKNNIFYENHGLYGSGNTYEQVYLNSNSAATFNNNQYYYPGTSGQDMFLINGVKRTLSEFKSLGQESNGVEGNPQFTNPSNNDYRLQEGSPCIGTGANLGSSYDDGLDPGNTNFLAFPPVVEMLDQDFDGSYWERGAYVYIYTGGVTQTCDDLGYCCPPGSTCSSPVFAPGCSGTCCASQSQCSENPHQAFLPDTPVEAESGTLESPMETASDPQAYGGSYIQTTGQYQGSAYYVFDINDPGDYYIKARIIAPTTADDSFYVGLDGEPAQGDEAYAWDTPEPVSWTWVNVSKRGLGTHDSNEFDPMVWTLSQGQHTFTIYGRETGTQLDQIILVPLSSESTDTCQSASGHCCSACSSGTAITDHDGDCSPQLCCGECYQQPQQPLCQGLVLLLHLDSDLSDSSGLGNDGTPSGTSFTSSGRFGEAISFGGSGDHALIPDDPSLDGFTDGATFSFWVRFASDPSGSRQTFLCKYDTETDRSWLIDFFDDSSHENVSLYFSDDKALYNKDTTEYDFSPNTWYHLAVQWIPGGLSRFWVNGIEETDVSRNVNDCGTVTSLADSADDLYAGKSSYDSGRDFVGDMDDVAIWNRSLSDNEIEGLSSIGGPVFCGAIHRADTTSPFGCITQTELVSFINLWYQDSTKYPMGEMMDAIGLFYVGTGC